MSAFKSPATAGVIDHFNRLELAEMKPDVGRRHGRSGTLTELVATRDTDMQGWPVGGNWEMTRAELRRRMVAGDTPWTSKTFELRSPIMR